MAAWRMSLAVSRDDDHHGRSAPAGAVRVAAASGPRPSGGRQDSPGPADSGAIPEWFQFYVGLESAASAMQEYNAELVTGLLQTEAYARAVMAAAMRADGEDEIDRQIAVRLERQKRLAAPDAPTLWATMNEAVLHRQVGGPEVMAAQLAHIGQLTARPNITIQVLPFTAGAHPAMLGSFTVMQFPDPADRDVVYLEAETGALYLEKPEDVRRYSLMIDYLRAEALGPAESRALLAQLAARTPA